MTSPHDRELEIFSEARRLKARERADYLEQACDRDAALRQRVMELLQAAEAAVGFLESPLASSAYSSVSTFEKPGDNIGRYKLLQQIGEGGCGAVYMAEQIESVRRKVALKIIKLGMDTKQVIARFEAERQTLALMDHPNIAKVLDAGATETGRPYFVMELVRGIKITEFCDKNHLVTKERLKLFVQVCQAIQHAHQKGIIHRDIKPSNILVTLNDGVPLPKVIDFGIAKATQQRLTDKTFFTAFEQFIGTPAYMSPEQAEMNAQGVDTRSDIYSLGVLLYELLTGQTPFAAEKLLQAGVNEIRRIIREEEPMRPSTKLSTMLEGELTMTARHRQTEPPKLIHVVRGDLDWIVMKALEKDRSSRYETANGFARDVERHLQGEPVAAHPPSRLYRFQKIVQRNRLLFAAITAVALVMALGIVASSWQAVRATRAEEQAAIEKQQADQSAAIANAVNEFLNNMFAAADADSQSPGNSHGANTTVAEVLNAASQRLDEGTFKGHPATEAAIREILGRTYRSLGKLKEADQQFAEALTFDRQVYGDESSVTVELLRDIYFLREAQEDYPAAEHIAREDLALQSKVHGLTAQQTAQALNELGDVLVAEASISGDLIRLQKYREAETSYRLALDIERGVAGTNALQLTFTLENLAGVLAAQEKFADVESLTREALRRQTNILGLEHTYVARTMGLLAARLIMTGQPEMYPEAESLWRTAIRIQEEKLGTSHPILASSWSSLGDVLQQEGKLPEAGTAYEKSIEIRRTFEPTNNIIFNSCVRQLAMNLLAQKRLPEAEAMFRQQLEFWKNAGPEHSALLYDAAGNLLECLFAEKSFACANSVYTNLLPNGPDKVADSPLAAAVMTQRYAHVVSLRNGGNQEAVALYLQALPLLRAATNDALQYDLRELGDALWRSGKPKDAEPYLREALTVYYSLHEREDQWGSALPTERLADCLVEQHKLADAEQMYRKALRCYTPDENSPAWGFRRVVRRIAKTLRDENKTVEIDSFYQEVADELQKTPTSARPQLAETWIRLAANLQAEGRAIEAETNYQKAVEIAANVSPAHLAEIGGDAVLMILEASSESQRREISKLALTAAGLDSNWGNELAWDMATTGNVPVWQKELALSLAQCAMNSSHGPDPGVLDTLAAAQALNGNFTNAIAVENKAISLLTDTNAIRDFASRLALYQSGKPFSK